MEQPVSENENVRSSISQTALLLIKQLRPKQWVKNAIVYFPLLFVGKFDDPHLLISATRGDRGVLLGLQFDLCLERYCRYEG